MLDTADGQFDWYHPGVRMPDRRGRWSMLRWRESAADDARAAIAEAYEFLVDRWEPATASSSSVGAAAGTARRL